MPAPAAIPLLGIAFTLAEHATFAAWIGAMNSAWDSLRGEVDTEAENLEEYLVIRLKHLHDRDLWHITRRPDERIEVAEMWHSMSSWPDDRLEGTKMWHLMRTWPETFASLEAALEAIRQAMDSDQG